MLYLYLISTILGCPRDDWVLRRRGRSSFEGCCRLSLMEWRWTAPKVAWTAPRSIALLRRSSPSARTSSRNGKRARVSFIQNGQIGHTESPAERSYVRARNYKWYNITFCNARRSLGFLQILAYRQHCTASENFRLRGWRPRDVRNRRLIREYCCNFHVLPELQIARGLKITLGFYWTLITAVASVNLSGDP